LSHYDNQNVTDPVNNTIYRFPINDVEIDISSEKIFVESPVFSNHFIQINKNEFSLKLDKIAHFYARDGKYIRISPEEGCEQQSIEVYLNGSIYGAILHQRGIMPLHGSCFVFNDEGVMICGDSGAGKSSLTTSFCLNGGTFLTDDVTPILMKSAKPTIWAMSDRIKLWEDSLEQLKLINQDLQKTITDFNKYYLPMESNKEKQFILSKIFILNQDYQDEIAFEEIKGVAKFVALRQQIYRDEFLKVMPETEGKYLEQLVAMSNQVKLVSVTRPVRIEIDNMRRVLTDYLSEQVLNTNPE